MGGAGGSDLMLEFSTQERWGSHRLSLDVAGRSDGQVDELESFRAARFVTTQSAAPRWTLRQAVASPFSSTLALEGVVQLYAYQPIDTRAILDFDRRITKRYSEFFAGHGEYYGGTFHCDELGPEWIVEVAALDAPSREIAEAAPEIELPLDVQEIVDECRSLQNRNRLRYLLWLEPQ